MTPSQPRSTNSEYGNQKVLTSRQHYNTRECPQCGFTTIYGMPGGRDATCTLCGYKDPCCYD